MNRLARAWAVGWPCLLFAGACGLLISAPIQSSWRARGALCFVGCVLFALYVAGLNWRHRRAANGSPPEQRGGHGGGVSLTWLLQGQQEGLRDDNLAAVPGLVQLINEPERSRSRTVESISLQGRVIGQKVAMEFQLPQVHQPAPRTEQGTFSTSACGWVITA